MSDILHAITTIILCNSLGEKNKIFSQQLINKKKNDIWPFREGPFFFVGPANTKNGTGENSSKRDKISKSK